MRLKNLLMLFFLINTSLFSQQINQMFEEYKTQLGSVYKNRATINDSDKIFVGSSGIVMHSFDESSKTIIARATVLAKDGIRALVELSPYDSLTQNTFPKALIIPKENDEIIINYLYGRSLIIAPNYETYKVIVNYFDKFDWVHPDILAAHLAKARVSAPGQKEFKKMCDINLSGLITINVAQKAYFVDCISFKILKTVSLPKIEDDEITLPFYSRISSYIDSSFLIWKGTKISSYESHYNIILGLENND